MKTWKERVESYIDLREAKGWKEESEKKFSKVHEQLSKSDSQKMSEMKKKLVEAALKGEGAFLSFYKKLTKEAGLTSKALNFIKAIFNKIMNIFRRFRSKGKEVIAAKIKSEIGAEKAISKISGIKVGKEEED